ncbi:peptidylprolyl isomerase [Thermoactinomyces sp. DSM 45892]|uniref:peptidylprolyl isomerase n=1 Tax=Thermoactinomyces sp. DSM 45892 TaxID=1882753 RepID=UPI00089459C9|nr:peptidylprolyl isomerase [Thermoactinomyces sp. DSM 45892]SDY24451.1 foldase protein PrsA [Thermoactinomyces sp. DSM 45892]
MYKYLKIVVFILISLLCITACSNEKVVTSKVGDITQEELATDLKQQFGKLMAYQMMIKKVLLHEAEVSDKEVDQKLGDMKKQTNQTVADMVKQFGLADEKTLREQVKVQLALEKAVKQSITDQDLKENYKPEIKASHILVSDEKTAKEVEEKVKKGEDFAALAKQYSIDTLSKEKGGDLGFFGPGTRQKAFEDATYKLKVGEISPPVKTDMGYHIIKVTEMKELKPFEQEKDLIRGKLEKKRLSDQAWQQQFLQSLLKKADVQVKDSTLKDAFQPKQPATLP